MAVLEHVYIVLVNSVVTTLLVLACLCLLAPYGALYGALLGALVACFSMVPMLMPLAMPYVVCQTVTDQKTGTRFSLFTI